MKNGALYSQAVLFATMCHHGQVRKGSGSPYIAHPIAVSALVIEYGGDEEQAAAALLHDVIEDCGVSRVELEVHFGERVAAIVEACTDGVPGADGKKEPWFDRKRAYLNSLAEKDPATLLVVLADKTHNAESIVHDLHGEAGHGVFERFSAPAHMTAWYYANLAQFFRVMVGTAVPAGLALRLEAAAGEIDRQMHRKAYRLTPA